MTGTWVPGSATGSRTAQPGPARKALPLGLITGRRVKCLPNEALKDVIQEL